MDWNLCISHCKILRTTEDSRLVLYDQLESNHTRCLHDNAIVKRANMKVHNNIQQQQHMLKRSREQALTLLKGIKLLL